MTRQRLVFFVALLVVAFGPSLVGGSPALIVPVILIFWLDMFGQGFGLPVAKDGGVDAFNLAPPSSLGAILIVIGSAVSLWAIWAIAGVLARWWVAVRRR